ncbi:SDR family NAD(P)-dependent oxidoreductase [Caulobacter sp. Root343]|uniref:SDR family NAD(P)-dependent oxidoreductase n=1 Tax=Caulobacter sp. Root343 TaxID=1736520 RepID=UPI001910C41F|nr:SDR family NAD(P)-dependent oxidoreductase [Caulobacter sp. Root343]
MDPSLMFTEEDKTMCQDRSVFEGGVAVITGAGAGLGEGLARRAAELGMALVLADIDQGRVDRLAEALRAGGTEVLALAVDVSRPEALDGLAAATHERFGDVRLLINNAGIETIGNSWELSAAQWDRTLDINIHGVVHGVRAFAPRMLAAGKPAYIANLASVGAFGQMPLQTAYMVTKHAVQAFSECLYLEMELQGKPIHVSSVIPGMVKTQIFADATPSGEDLASKHREVMRQTMAAYGMELDAACKVILEQIAAGEFWVSTQPEMTQNLAQNRAVFLRDQSRPALTPETRALLEA